jgi:hypothetical protein
MRHQLLILVAVFVAGLILVQAIPAAATGKTHDLKATVVSVDIPAKKITFKDEAGTTTTAPVLDRAVETLKTFKGGEKVVLTCQDNESGNHEGVIAIRPAEGEKS